MCSLVHDLSLASNQKKRTTLQKLKGKYDLFLPMRCSIFSSMCILCNLHEMTTALLVWLSSKIEGKAMKSKGLRIKKNEEKREKELIGLSRRAFSFSGRMRCLLLHLLFASKRLNARKVALRHHQTTALRSRAKLVFHAAVRVVRPQPNV